MPERRVAIVTDSIACLPEELVQRYDIGIVPVQVIFGERVYRDGVDLKPQDFYRMLAEARQIPTTAPPPPGAFLDAYRQAASKAASVLAITVSSTLSRLHESAVAAADEARQETGVPIEVVDSRIATMSQGFIVLAAARAAERGADLAEAKQAAESLVSRVRLLATLDSFDYLVRGGHVRRAQAWAGRLIKVNPILHCWDGDVGLLEWVRTRRRAKDRLLSLMKQEAGSIPIHASVFHAAAPGEAEELRRRVEAEFNCAEMYITPFSPVMGTHTGPGVIGVSYYVEP